MKVLMLTCNTGEGHNSTAAAIQEVFRREGVCCDTVDALAFVSEKASKFICNWHVRLYRYIPRAYRIGYRYAEGHPSLFKEDSGVYRILTSGMNRLYEYLQEGGYDTAICSHVFPALLLTEMKKHYTMTLYSAFVATDYTCYPITGETDVDTFFIPEQGLENEFVMNGVAKQRIVASGIPVRTPFLTREDKRQAKERLGIRPDCRHLLMMCGSMGCGPIEELAQGLAERLPENVVLTVVCGTNERLHNRLEKRLKNCANVRLEGYTEQIPLLMDSADVYLTKPGGLSTTEAAMKRLPMILVNAVAGCEEYNLEYFTENGMAVTADKPEGLVEACLSLVSDRERLSAMADAMEKHFSGDPAQLIFDVVRQGLERKIGISVNGEKKEKMECADGGLS